MYTGVPVRRVKEGELPGDEVVQGPVRRIQHDVDSLDRKHHACSATKGGQKEDFVGGGG